MDMFDKKTYSNGQKVQELKGNRLTYFFKNGKVKAEGIFENNLMGTINVLDAIKNSRLPDEIKKLMMEHPISQPQQQQTATLSNDLIERASRLMKENPGNYVPDSAKSKQETQSTQPSPSTNIDYKLLRKMINEAVNDALKENGLLVESTDKTNELFSFKVGKHIFEGKVTKIKKLS
jgi:hypothetical protein